MRITTETLDKWGACCRAPGEKYDDDHLRARGWPDEGLTPLELSLQRWIPVEDRIWGLLRPEVLGEDLQQVLYNIVDPWVKSQCLHCGITEVEVWAGRWLSGEDRTEAAAWAAAEAAWAAAKAAEAAWAAAWLASAEAARTTAWLASAEVAARTEHRDPDEARRSEQYRQLRIIRKYLRRQSP